MFAWSIPLRPTEKPLELPHSVRETAHQEYLVKYLEHIGAEPTAANIALVRKQIPLRSCKLTAAFKSRGSLDDSLHVSQKQSTPALRRQWRTVASKSMFAEVAAKQILEHEDPRTRTPNLVHRASPSLPSGVKALQPDSREHLPLISNSHSPLQRSKSPRSIKREEGGSPKAMFQSSIDLLDGDNGHEDHSSANIESPSKPLEITIEDILAIQTMFTRSFPFESLQHRISPDDEAMAMAEITSITMAQFIKNICFLLHHCIIKPGPSPLTNDWIHTMGVSAGGEVDEMMLLVYKGYVDLMGRLKRRQHVVVLFPLFLLSMRVTIETIFRNNFPKLFHRYGLETLSKIDIMLELIFDPDGYHKNMALLSAFHTISDKQNGNGSVISTPRPPKRMDPHGVSKKFYTTSPIVKEVLGVNASPKVRAILAQAERMNPRPVMGGHRDSSGLPQSIITPSNMPNLYQIAMKKFQIRNSDGLLQKKAAQIQDSLDMLLPIFAGEDLMNASEGKPSGTRTSMSFSSTHQK